MIWNNENCFNFFSVGHCVWCLEGCYEVSASYLSFSLFTMYSTYLLFLQFEQSAAILLTVFQD
jgi:hypothetical protein